MTSQSGRSPLNSRNSSEQSEDDAHYEIWEYDERLGSMGADEVRGTIEEYDPAQDSVLRRELEGERERALKVWSVRAKVFATLQIVRRASRGAVSVGFDEGNGSQTGDWGDGRETASYPP